MDKEVAEKYGKIVANTPKVNSYSVAEFTLGLIFALNQNLLQFNEETRNLIGEKELLLMKKEAFLINTARAEIINALALYKCLANNNIARCAFDGFYKEPIDLVSEESNLLTLPTGKFLLTPHTGFNAIEGTSRVENMCIDNLIKILNNEPCQSIVTK